ncbi:MAG: preprotein translocase subunit YajC [Puniceicoccaceae bacterium]|nr:MAG: preprotein translocase subunit YajC [Puniceicoccaceae bacterium]
MDFLPLILAQQEGAPSGVLFSQILFFGLFFAAMWFLLIAPQRRKQKEHQRMIEALDTGDAVITAGGVYGVITNKKDDRFTIKVADNTKLEVGKSFIHALDKKAGS